MITDNDHGDKEDNEQDDSTSMTPPSEASRTSKFRIAHQFSQFSLHFVVIWKQCMHTVLRSGRRRVGIGSFWSVTRL